jgi:hypothetical protein
MRRTISALVATAVVLTAVACGDSTMSPTQAPTKSSAPSVAAFSSTAASYARLTPSGFDFVITPAGGSVNVGGLFTLNFPANSVCDPNTSSYGPGTWDSSCALANGTIHEHATLSATSSGIRVDFGTPLRFVPSQTVTISTSIFSSLIRSGASFYRSNLSSIAFLSIQYDASLSGAGVNDASTDPSLVTSIDFASGTISRRVKHFSGYGVAMGDGVCDPTIPDDPDCAPPPEGK